MAETETTADAPQETPPAESLEHGVYEVIRNRLAAAGKELRTRLEKLNAARKDVFGAIDTVLLATERISTANNCTARDMTPVGDCFLFGYKVHIGLKTEMALGDVFAIYRFHDHTFSEQPLDLIADENFHRDFRELLRYYKKAVFAKFAVIGPHLFMVFRISDDPRDVKTFKWLLEGDRLRYIDARSDHEYRFPPQHDFEWTRTRRDMHSKGEFPHVSIEDRLFVETVGGDLTIKIEDNTDTGGGIYAEDVDNPDQTLDDAEIFYAIVGNLILLKIRPYQEEKYRYFVYSEKTQQARRLDTIEKACVLLPGDHGLIFSNGYFLQTGECKTFETSALEMIFARRLQSPNGEDFLYVFYNRRSGLYILLPYNLIEQKVETPIICSGYSFFANGQMVYFKAQDEPQRHHALQIWQTPYVGQDYEPPTAVDSFLYRVGNQDIVRGMAECHEVLGLIAKEDTYANLFVDLAKKVGDMLDAYYWLDHADAFNPREVLQRVKEAAEAAISEFEKVVAVRRNTTQQTSKVVARAREVASEIHSRRFAVIGDFVASLVDLRGLRGDIIGLRDLRYVDSAKVESLEAEIQTHADRVANRCVEFLLDPRALQPYEAAVAEQLAAIDPLEKVADARQLKERVSTSASELEMLIEIVSNLKIDDATQRTAIIDAISDVFSKLNQVRAGLKTKMRDLMRTEGVAEFNSQIKLLNQSVVNYLDVCDTPERCEEFLTKMMIQIEELEGRFAEFDEFVGQLTEKREEVYNAFETRKLQLIEARNKRVTALAAAADRILKGIKARVDAFTTVNEIHGYFASDLMIEKVRDLVDDLAELGDSVKVDDIQSRLKTIREDAVRQLKDRQELYEEGDSVIRLGKDRFSVNNQALDLTTVVRDGQMYYHLTGTNFFQQIADPEFLATRDVWSQEVVSENAEVYRGEYLAYQILTSAGSDGVPEIQQLAAAGDEDLAGPVQRFMGPRYSEGYVKGVHDHDAAIILRALAQIGTTVGLLRFHPQARALATLFWFQFEDAPRKDFIAGKLKGFGSIRELFPETETQTQYIGELRELIGGYVSRQDTFAEHLVDQAAEYLFEELTGEARFVISSAARDLYHAFSGYIEQKFFTEKYNASVEELKSDANAAFLLQRDWVTAFLATRNDPRDADYAEEVAVLLTTSFDVTRVVEASVHRELTGMVGNHPLIEQKTYRLNYNTFLLKLERYRREVVPRFETYGRLKKELVDRQRDGMRLDEFRPRVLTSFVRNKLLDRVYLPMVGANLAKQIGVVGEAKRTDRMGLLLVISPPGYGKTTLMEYIANRLGIIFMKINGPALGHQVTSLDPAEAPNAAAREEMQKLNLSFEMGDNVMIYLDDIQHCNPEFLQKFISLCDAQRKIEGVYNGRTRTYDLRGKKVAVVMAGNPYTESGEKFKIPDMLANRADTYNLGEVIGDNADSFVMSYLENCLTSNPVLDKLASRSQQDVYAVMQMAEGTSPEGVDLEGNYSMAEVDEMVAVMRKLMRVRDVVLAVNEEYIRSAGMGDEYRTEPAFKLQGSYRNMNRIAEKVVGIMNDEELEALIFSNYQNDAQTLTTGAESNLLKFKEMTGRITPTEADRWTDIKRTFSRNVQLKGVGEDQKFGQMIVQLTNFSDGLDRIKQVLDSGLDRMTEPREEVEPAEPAELTASFDAQTLGAINQLVEQLQSRAAAASDDVQPELQAPPPQEIRVVSRVPSAILSVLRNQFQLMQGWLEPIHRSTSLQTSEMKKLRELIDGNQQKYQELIGQLEEAARTGDTVFETLAKHKVQVDQSRQQGKKKRTGKKKR
ncbi:MAG: DNA repair ATPase [Planctomycetes bacterium]|nr:DNA repair ATPase [Planctomycetota bacterium]